MGYNPKTWGKQAWHFIHMVALAFPDPPTESDKNNYKAFFDSLQNVLPCPICSEHLKQNMVKFPPIFDNREVLFNWTVDLHNMVNEANNKPKISHQEAIRQIEITSKANMLPKTNLSDFRIRNAVNKFESIKKIQL